VGKVFRSGDVNNTMSKGPSDNPTAGTTPVSIQVATFRSGRHRKVTNIDANALCMRDARNRNHHSDESEFTESGITLPGQGSDVWVYTKKSAARVAARNRAKCSRIDIDHENKTRARNVGINNVSAAECRTERLRVCGLCRQPLH